MERADGAERIRQTLERTLRDERGRWLLSHGIHREASSERRLTGVYENQVINVVIDRMLVDASGTRWIVDFKTGGHEGGDLQEFVDREVERYRPQLQRYAVLARRLGPESVRCALYFPVLGIFREL
jgi:ATP-dependent exoDNAse (exonuclease V) beta subunit